MAIPIITRAAVSSLLLATTMIASTGIAQSLPAGHARAAAAESAMAAGDRVVAVGEGEAAVAASPDIARYRTLLGRAYLATGRFASAETSFGEALTLDASDGRAAGGLILAQLAQGRPGAARANLVDHGRIIPRADLGLLAVFAGEPQAGVLVLEAAVREPGAGVRARQNLALAYAIAGRWADARTTAAIDLGEQGAEARMLQWSVATNGGVGLHILVGQAATSDPGRPATLALGRTGAVHVALAPVQPVQADPAEMPLALTPAAPSAPIQFAGFAGLQFAPRREVVQPLPAGYRAAGLDRSTTLAAARPVSQPGTPSSNWVVQIGAYATPALATGAWARTTERHPLMAGHEGVGGTVTRDGRTLYRLSASGFAARGDAVELCERFRRRGGRCFVRPRAQDAPLAIAFAPARLRLAAR